MVVEIHFFQHHATVTFPPHAAWNIANDVVAVDDIEKEAASRLERAADGRGDAQVGFLVEVAE